MRGNGGDYAGIGPWKRRLFFSKWTLGLTCTAGGIELGMLLGWWMHGFSIDGGVATLIGALGGIGMLGWAKQFSALSQDAPIGMFFGEGASSIRREAYILSKLCEFRESQEPESYAHVLRQQARHLLDTMSRFEKRSPHLTVRSYRAHTEIETLESVARAVRITLGNEVNELEKRPTRPVIGIAKKKLAKCCAQLMSSCDEVCSVVGFVEGLPTDAEVGFAIEEVRRRHNVGT
jgi:hypothetical protein